MIAPVKEHMTEVVERPKDCVLIDSYEVHNITLFGKKIFKKYWVGHHRGFKYEFGRLHICFGTKRHNDTGYISYRRGKIDFHYRFKRKLPFKCFHDEWHEQYEKYLQYEKKRLGGWTMAHILNSSLPTKEIEDPWQKHSKEFNDKLKDDKVNKIDYAAEYANILATGDSLPLALKIKDQIISSGQHQLLDEANKVVYACRGHREVRYNQTMVDIMEARMEEEED